MSLTAYWREEDHAAPLAYVAGTFGALVGADVLRFWEFVQQPAPEVGAVASIGGASVFDMVFLTGVVAVGLDALVFRRREKERAGGHLPYTEAEAFTVGTSPERMAAWTVPDPVRDARPRGETVRARPQSVASIVQEPSAGVRRPRPVVEDAQDDRLSRHRAWEEQMQRQRGR